jgi:UDP-GlcNAc:undecaprenyl-phosphate/decaprenyl-phosphate GlcNAc-1-phosphate transferase
MGTFVLSEKDLIKLSVMIVFASAFFGLFGLIVMLGLQWLTRQTYAQDVVEKHGIADAKASRLGGVAALLVTCVLLLLGSLAGFILPNEGLSGVYYSGWFGCVACASLGLIEDFRNDILEPGYRLLAKALIFTIVLWQWPTLIPSQLGFPVIDSLLSIPLLAWLFTLLFCVGFLNAVNMADGANGLMPGVFFIAFTIFYLQTGGLVYSALMTSSGLFLIFNVISGRLFLGDAGAYGFGAAVVLAGLYLHSVGAFSASFLATLLMYPCVELLVSMGRRLLLGRSIFLPDNDHLHNRIYFHLQRRLRSNTLANSLTGLAVALASSGVALVGFLAEWWPVSDNRWIAAFITQCVIYTIVFILSGLNRKVSQNVVAS